MDGIEIKFSDITLGKSKTPMQTKKLKVLKEESDDESIVDTKNNNVKHEHKVVNQKKEVDVVGTLLSYKGTSVSIIKNVLGEDWWKAVHVTKPLGYVNSEQAIRHVVSSFNKKSHGELLNYNQLQCSGLKFEKNDMNSIYINTAGVFELLSKSRKKEAKEFQQWVNCDVLPSINKTGQYTLYDDKANGAIFKFDEKLYEDYVKKNSAFDIKNENTLYLIYIGEVEKVISVNNTNLKVKEHCFKYGITYRGVVRSDEHASKIGKMVMFYAKKCVNNRALEDALSYELDKKGLKRNCVFGKSNYTELFTISSDFTVDDIRKFIDKWVSDNDVSKSDDIILAEELTKQKQLDVEKEKIIFERMKIELEILRIKEKK